MQYLDAISERTEWSLFVSKATLNILTKKKKKKTKQKTGVNQRGQLGSVMMMVIMTTLFQYVNSPHTMDLNCTESMVSAPLQFLRLELPGRNV